MFSRRICCAFFFSLDFNFYFSSMVFRFLFIHFLNMYHNNIVINLLLIKVFATKTNIEYVSKEKKNIRWMWFKWKMNFSAATKPIGNLYPNRGKTRNLFSWQNTLSITDNVGQKSKKKKIFFYSLHLLERKTKYIFVSIE